MVPPIPLIARALSQAKICKIKVTLVAPLWTTSSFWPVIMNDFTYVKGDLRVKGAKVLTKGRNQNSIFGSTSFQGDILVLRLDFT